MRSAIKTISLSTTITGFNRTSGLAMLHSGQSTAGLPALPPPAAAAPSAALAGLPTLTAADSSDMLDQQSQQADQLITRAKALAF